MSNKTLTILALFLLSTALVFAGCSGADSKENVKHDMHNKPMDKTSMTSSHDDHSGRKMHGEDCSHDHEMYKNTGKMNMSGTMIQVNKAEKLYSCPMHPEVVSTDSETPCPLCNMKLNEMTDDKVKELLSSNPKGCPMDPIVVKGNSKLENCPVCKMKLNSIELSSHSGKVSNSHATGVKTSGCSCCNT